MPKSPERPDPPDNGEDLEKSNRGLEREPRYTPGEYRVEIPVDAAKADIERNFPDLRVKQIEYLSEGMGSAAFLVNSELVFRFAKNEKADASIKKEIVVLPEIAKRIDLAIPAFEYKGAQRNQLRMVGYEKIEGEDLKRSDFIGADGRVDAEPVKQLASFFRELHSIDPATAKQWGLREQNFHSLYENGLEDARGRVYPAMERAYPADEQQIKDYTEELFSGYLSDQKNFEYTAAVLHGDLEAEHILFDKQSRKITGIIDWGGVRIGDPDYDLFRPYSHFGSEFVEELLKHYPHDDPDRLRRKLDFFFRAQMAHRAVRAIMLGDQEGTELSAERLRKHALGLGYWYHGL
ncbi:MAG: aminoglycoside phosphotransferase family protein [Candidatus Liptonbacteria bacterium]|nr:aminoglycoside phosphotransferase family protein [Candidatus Liptonbacteria bacterium]